MDSKPGPFTANRSGEVMRTLLADIQLAIEQFSRMKYFYGSYCETDGDVDGNSWHKDKKGKKPAKGGAVRKEEVEGRVTLPPPIDNASENAPRPPSDEVSPDGYRHPRSLGKEKEEQRKSELPRNVAAEVGIHPVTQQLLTPQSMKAPPRNSNSNGSLPGPASPGLPNWISTATNDAKAQPSAQPVMPSTAQFSSPQGITNVLLSPLSLRDAALFSPKKDQYVHPTDWTVKETIDWLRSKGFDEAVCAKFVEGEIAGHALLDLDVTTLKTEIGIIAYGKRFRIARAIAELRCHARVRSFLTRPPARAGSSSRGGPPAQQRTRMASSPLPTHFTDVGSQVKPTGRPDPSELRKLSPLPEHRDLEPDVWSPVDSPTESYVRFGPRDVTSPSPTSGMGKGGILKGTSSQLSRALSDGALHANGRSVAVGHDARKGERAPRSSHRTKDPAAPHNEHWRSRSPPAVKISISSPQLMEHTTPSPQETIQLDKIHRSRSVGTLSSLKSHLRYLAIKAGALSDRSSFSLPQPYHGKGTNNNSTTSIEVNVEVVSHREEDNREQHELNDDPSDSKEKGVLVRLGTPDHQGWMLKQGRRLDVWKNRYFVLKDSYLYWLKSDSLLETKVKGYINIVECHIVRAENVDFGRSGFKLLRESDRTHLFSSDDKTLIKGWIEAFLKQLDVSRKAVLSSADVPLADTRAMTSVPRPASPTALGATQRTIRRDSADMPYMRDVKLVMGTKSVTSFHSDNDKTHSQIRTWRSFSGFEAIGPASPSTSAELQAPVRPSRDTRRNKPKPELSKQTSNCQPGMAMASEGFNYSRPELLRIARSISDIMRPTPFKSVCSQESNDEAFECLSNLVDLLLDKDVKMGIIDTQDMSEERVDRRKKIIRLLRSLRAWEERRREILRSIKTSPLQGATQERIANH